MPLVELNFPLRGRTLPYNNGYLIYAAISRALNHHLPEGVAVSSVGGTPLSDWRLGLTGRERLRLRLQSDLIGEVLGLAGQLLNVGGHEVALGVPEIRMIHPTPSLAARLVTIKGFQEPGPFLEAARRKLLELDITGEVSIPILRNGMRAGQFKRRVLNIKGTTIIGFALIVEKLGPEGSERLLTHGLGGRRRMGCGIFVPVDEREGDHE